jgi:mRNA interferase MazF
MVNKGDIVLVKFPFSQDISKAKARPAVILWVNSMGDDVTLCAITSQNVDRLFPEDIPLLLQDSEFSITGLKSDSKIRAARISTSTKQCIIRKFGKPGPQKLQFLNAKLIEMFQL